MWRGIYHPSGLRLHESNPSVELFISIGQSNESGRGTLATKESGIPQVTTLGNDYVWKQLEEPADSAVNQVDTVSSDTSIAGHSSLVKMGKDLYAAIGKQLMIVPNAKGGTTTTQWQPPGTRYDRSSLYGSADYRTKIAMDNGGILKAFLWTQGESDGDNPGTLSGYITRHTAIVNTLRAAYGNIPFFYGQLAPNRGSASGNDAYQQVREFQRLMETDSGSPYELPLHYMVPFHDLSMLDQFHLDTAGQLEYGRRRALAIRQIVYGHAVNGLGPRLAGISKPTSTQIKVKINKSINSHTSYDNYFTVYDNGVVAPIASIQRDPGDSTAVLITLSSAPAGTVTVEYKPPYDRAINTRMVNVVQDTDGLPLPAFGPLGLF